MVDEKIEENLFSMLNEETDPEYVSFVFLWMYNMQTNFFIVLFH